MNDELVLKALRARDDAERVCIVLGIAFLALGLGFVYLFGLNNLDMTVFYAAYVVLILSPAMYLYMIGRGRRFVRAVMRRPTKHGLGTKEAAFLPTADIILLSVPVVGIAYMIPLLVIGHWWAPARTAIDTAGLGPCILAVGVAYLLYALAWRRHVRPYLLEMLAEAGVEVTGKTSAAAEEATGKDD
ncbi:MAG: hypothetical protein ABFD96_02795 [Armatimonadia bacterium]